MVLENLGLQPEEVWTGEYYRTYVVENVSVAELDDHRIFYEEAEEIGRDFIEKLQKYPHVNATVDVVTMEKAAGNLLLDAVEETAKEAREYGLEKYGIVSDDITKYAMANKVDVEGVEVFVTDDVEEALEWAME